MGAAPAPARGAPRPSANRAIFKRPPGTARRHIPCLTPARRPPPAGPGRRGFLPAFLPLPMTKELLPRGARRLRAASCRGALLLALASWGPAARAQTFGPPTDFPTGAYPPG